MPVLEQTDSRILRTVLLACLAILALRFALTLIIPLTDNTEARYGEVSRLILEYSDWITLHYDSDTAFLGKPPLSFWLSAIGIHLFGANEFGPRLPILLLAVASVSLLYRFVAANSSRDLAARSALVLSGSLFFFVNAAVIQTDFVLAFCCLWAMIAFWNYRRDLDNKIQCWSLFAALGCGFLAKGLAVGVFAVLPIVASLLASGQWRQLGRHTAWISGIGVGLLVVAPWLIAAELRTPGFLEYFFIGEHFQRLIEAGWSGDRFGTPKAQVPGTIVLFCLAGMLPWTLFAVKLFSADQRRSMSARLSEHRQFLQYLAIWTTVPLLALLLVPNYLFPYVISICIPLSVLVAVTLLSQTSVKRMAQVALSVPIVITLATVFIANSPQANKYTQKNIVGMADEHCGNRDCQLLFIAGRKFSADYYSRKRARQIDLIELERALSPETHDFFVTPSKVLPDIPEAISSRFNTIGQFHRMLLLEEREQ